MKRLLTSLLLTIGLTAQAGYVDVSWSNVTNATGYKVYYGTKTKNYTITNDVGNVTSATVTGLVNMITYYFVITAYNELYESAYSKEVVRSIPALPPPTDSIMILSQGQPPLFSWDYSTMSDTMKGFTYTVSTTNRSFQPNNCFPAHTYQFKVCAYTTYGSLDSTNYRLITTAATTNATYYAPIVPYTGTPFILPPRPLETGGKQVLFFGSPGYTNYVYGSANLRSWSLLGSAIELSPGQYELADPVVRVLYFYKVR